MRATFAAVSIVMLMLAGCDQRIELDAFEVGDLKVLDPLPRPDGSWFLPIQYELEGSRFRKPYFEARVRSGVIELRAYSTLWALRPANGVHIRSLEEGTYSIDFYGHSKVLVTGPVTARRTSVDQPDTGGTRPNSYKAPGCQ